MNLILVLVTAICGLATQCAALNNGVGILPAMGWRTWERFRCQTDCPHFPYRCINQDLIFSIADHMVSDGWLEAGYQYIVLDGCQFDDHRDPKTHKMLPAYDRFPGGIRAVADYLHGKGLLLGIWVAMGKRANDGSNSPGIHDHHTLDAQTFADWKVDMVAVWGQTNNTKEFRHNYVNFGHALNKTGRPILYECEWPQYWNHDKKAAVELSDTCNQYYFGQPSGVNDDYLSVTTNIDLEVKYSDVIEAATTGVNKYIYLDQLVGGNYGLTTDMAQSQLVWWLMVSSPFFLSHDLREPSPFDVLAKNKYMIDILEDPNGLIGQRIYSKNATTNQGPVPIEVWTLGVDPIVGGQLSTVIAYLNRKNFGEREVVCRPVHTLLPECGGKSNNYDGHNNKCRFVFYDIFNNYEIVAKLGCHDTLSVEVNPYGARLLKAVPVGGLGDHCQGNACYDD